MFINHKTVKQQLTYADSRLEILAVTPEVYNSVVQKPFTIFHGADFNVLNAASCEQVLYLLFRDKKFRLGLIGGIRDNVFYSPLSAPFGGFSLIKKDVRIHFIDEALVLLQRFLNKKNVTQIHITLPPFQYGATFLSKVSNALLRQNYTLKSNDLNHYFELTRWPDHYLEKIKHSARKHIAKAQKHNLGLIKAETITEKKEAYAIIEYNRKARGNPLHLSWEKLQKTILLVKADFFLLGTPGAYVAAAINFYVLPEVVQIIYWGSLPEKNDLRPMNLLAYKVFEYYHQKGFHWLDLGQSSIQGIPQQGLCNFKESMACAITLKQSFSKNIS